MAVRRKKYSYKHRVVTRPVGYGRTSKKKGKFIKAFLLLCFVALICFLIYRGGKKVVGYVYASDSVIIKEIDVVGCKNVTKTEIKELLPFTIGDNILKVDLSETEKKIMEVKPELKAISVKRRWQKIKVKLYERTPEAFINSGKEILGIDFENKPFPLRGFMSGMKIPTLIYEDDKRKERLLEFLKRLKPVCGDFLGNIVEIKYSNTDDIVFKTHDGAVIFWGDERPEHMVRKFDKFKKIYDDATRKYASIDHIDMTFYDIGRATVKPKTQDDDADKGKSVNALKS